MIKNKIKIVLLVSIILASVSLTSTVYKAFTKSTKEEAYITKGNEYLENELYFDAINNFTKAKKLKGNRYEEAVSKIVDVYFEREDTYGAIEILKNELKHNKSCADFYNKLAKLYIEDGELKEAIHTLKKGVKNTEDENLKKFYEEIRYQAELSYNGYDNIIPSNLETFIATNNNQSFLVSDKGKALTEKIFTCLTNQFMEDNEDRYFAIDRNVLSIIDNNMERRKINKELKPQKIRLIKKPYAAVLIDNKWKVIDDELLETGKEFEDIGSFSDGIIPAKNEGKWGMVNSKFESKVDYKFDNIAISDNGLSYAMDRFFGSENGKYFLYNGKGERITDEAYDDAYPFIDSYAAVKKDGLWFFIDKKGQRKDEETYIELKSFSADLAPFKEGSSWGYVTKDGRKVIEPVFESVTPFNEKNGIAVVEVDGQKHLLSLLEYQK